MPSFINRIARCCCGALHLFLTSCPRPAQTNHHSLVSLYRIRYPPSITMSPHILFRSPHHGDLTPFLIKHPGLFGLYPASPNTPPTTSPSIITSPTLTPPSNTSFADGEPERRSNIHVLPTFPTTSVPSYPPPSLHVKTREKLYRFFRRKANLICEAVVGTSKGENRCNNRWKHDLRRLMQVQGVKVDPPVPATTRTCYVTWTGTGVDAQEEAIQGASVTVWQGVLKILALILVKVKRLATSLK